HPVYRRTYSLRPLSRTGRYLRCNATAFLYRSPPASADRALCGSHRTVPDRDRDRDQTMRTLRTALFADRSPARGIHRSADLPPVRIPGICSLPVWHTALRTAFCHVVPVSSPADLPAILLQF